MKINWSKG